LEVELSELDLSTFTSWSKVKPNLAENGQPLSIAGTQYEKGVGVHALSEGHIRLDGKGGTFTALVGVDDHVGDPSIPALTFYVFTNKGTAFNSGVMKWGDAPKSVNIDLRGVTDLYLVVDPGADLNHDHADWAEARFNVYSAPVAVAVPAEEKYLLTPPPAPSPRINGSKVIGASPAKPFLFTIAATGERPVHFAAEGLPEGLSLDAETGIITGSCSQAGDYLVPVTATNSRGACRDTLEIVIGGGLALTPYMGWNSWNAYGLSVTQENMQQSAQAMYDNGMVQFGYSYIGIDNGWAIKIGSDDPVIGGPTRNPDGSIRPNRKFPDMKAMTGYIHRLGLKAGMYSSPGRAACGGGYTGSLGHEAQDAKTFADWGFDLLKYDWCAYEEELSTGNHETAPLEELIKPFRLMGTCLQETDRDFIFNLCQYGMGDVWKWGQDIGGHAWRTTGDIGGNMKGLTTMMFQIGFYQEPLGKFIRPGGWNDLDFLLFGNVYHWDNQPNKPTTYSPSEHYFCMTLWSMLSTPLIFSGDLSALDDFTKNVLCNAEVIDIDQDKLGKPGYSVYSKELIDIWKKDLHDGTTALAIFNRRPMQTAVPVDWKALGYDGDCQVRDVWRQTDLGDARNIRTFDVPRHGCVLVKISNK
jgi:alpha-galactosidase